MRYIYTLALFAIQLYAIAGGGCTPDMSNTEFFNPRPDTMPCIKRNLFYEQVVQMYIPGDFDLQTIAPNLPFPVVVTIDSIIVNGISGFPNGINYSLNPSSGVLHGDSWACLYIAGTTGDPAGNYPLTLSGFIYLSNLPVIPGANQNPDTVFSLAFVQSLSPSTFSLFVDVIEQGAVCRMGTSLPQNTEGISALQVYPNPSNGHLQASWYSKATEGNVSLVNTFGQIVYQSYFSGTGTQQLQIQTSNFKPGVYTFEISTAKGRSYKKLIIR